MFRMLVVADLNGWYSRYSIIDNNDMTAIKTDRTLLLSSISIMAIIPIRRYLRTRREESWEIETEGGRGETVLN